MCTHLHADHVGWNTRLVDGRQVPTFPNARYVFAETEFGVWSELNKKGKKEPDGRIDDSVLPVVEAGQADIVADDYAFNDHIWFEQTPAIRPAMSVSACSRTAPLCRATWCTPRSRSASRMERRRLLRPRPAAETRRAFLERYCETDTLVMTGHFRRHA